MFNGKLHWVLACLMLFAAYCCNVIADEPAAVDKTVVQKVCNKATFLFQDQIEEWMNADPANRESMQKWLKRHDIEGSESLWLQSAPKDILTAAVRDLGILPRLMQRRIEERRAQAVELRIVEKAIHTTYHLGKGSRDELRDGKTMTNVIFHDASAGVGLSIVFRNAYDDGRLIYESLQIWEAAETVFLCENGIIKGYVPGGWEVELNKLQYPADIAKKAMDAEQALRATESDSETAFRKAWGPLH